MPRSSIEFFEMSGIRRPHYDDFEIVVHGMNESNYYRGGTTTRDSERTKFLCRPTMKSFELGAQDNAGSTRESSESSEAGRASKQRTIPPTIVPAVG